MSGLGDIINAIGASQMGSGYKEAIAPLALNQTQNETSGSFTPIKPNDSSSLAKQIGVDIMPPDENIPLTAEEKEIGGRFYPGGVSPKRQQSILSKIMEYTNNYSVTAPQAAAIYDVLSSPLSSATVNKDFEKIQKSPELDASVQRLLGSVAETAKTNVPYQYTIKTENLKYPSSPGVTVGETVKEKAIAAANKYNDTIKNYIDTATKFLNTLTDQKTADSLTVGLTSSLAYDVAKELNRSSNGQVDVTNFYNQATEIVSSNKKFLTNATSILSDLFNMKIDLLSEVNNLLS